MERRQTRIPWADWDRWSLPEGTKLVGVIAFLQARTEIDFLLGLRRPFGIEAATDLMSGRRTLVGEPLKVPLEIEYSSSKDPFVVGVRDCFWAYEDVDSFGQLRDWMEMDQFNFSIHHRLVLGRDASKDTEKQGLGLEQK